MHAISVSELDVSWGARVVLPKFCLHVDPGEVLCIVGPGGSGKSTIVRVFERLLAGAAVEVGTENLQWRGESTVGVRSCACLRQQGVSPAIGPVPGVGVGPVPGVGVGPIPGVGVGPVPGVGPAAAVLPESKLDPRQSAELEQLYATANASMADTPKALRHFNNFMRVANAPAELLLFDEPLFSLPQRWAKEVTSRLRTLAESGRTMVVVTHYLPLARMVADRVALLVDGELIESAPTEDFFSRARHLRTRQYLEWGS